MAKIAPKTDRRKTTRKTADTITAPPVTTEAIAARAFEHYLARGGSHGSDVEDWLKAEAELRTS